nr:hypothetical protein Itr_chr11CG21590 [Ipomoea trifida]
MLGSCVEFTLTILYTTDTGVDQHCRIFHIYICHVLAIFSPRNILEALRKFKLKWSLALTNCNLTTVKKFELHQESVSWDNHYITCLTL